MHQSGLCCYARARDRVIRDWIAVRDKDGNESVNSQERKKPERAAQRAETGGLHLGANGVFPKWTFQKFCRWQTLFGPNETGTSGEGRAAEGDAESVPSRLWLAGATELKASSIVRLVFIVWLLARSPDGNCRLSSCCFLLFLFFSFLQFSLYLFFYRDILVLLNNKTAFCPSTLISHHSLIL